MSTARPLRVLTVVPRGLAGRGGIETLFSHVRATLEEHPETGIEMRFFASRGDASGAGWALRFPFAYLAYVFVLASGRFDLVHLNVATNASTWRKRLMQRTARLFGLPVVAHFHGSAFPAPGAKRPVWVSMLKRVFADADAVIVLGSYWRDFIARFYDMAPDRFDVVANGVADFAPDAPAGRGEGATVEILFAGNLTDAKGAGTLVEALSLMPSDLPHWHATLAGTGDVEGFRARVAALGLADRVGFTGWLAREKILPLYRAADIVVLPSRREVLPVCLIEGTCAGAALVATPVGSVPDVVVDGEDGFLVPVDDARALAGKLAELVADGAKREAFRLEARKAYLEKFRLEEMVAGLDRVYRKALARHRGG